MIAEPTTFAPESEQDLDLARRVENFLHSKQMRSLRQVDVAAERGTVVLRGDVASFYEKQLCLSCTRRVAGVINLVDEIQVRDLNAVSMA